MSIAISTALGKVITLLSLDTISAVATVATLDSITTIAICTLIALQRTAELISPPRAIF